MPIPFGEKVVNHRGAETSITMILRPVAITLVLGLTLLSGCSGATAMHSFSSGSSAPAVAWAPTRSDTFQSQLTGTIDTSTQESVYTVDGFDTGSPTIATLQERGDHVVCYVDAGTYESWRPDAAAFRAHPSVIGSTDAGWPGEYWLDIRRLDVLGPIMQARFKLCKSKGFNAIEPDNVDGFRNETGFPLTRSDQLTYNTWLAGQAHALGMAIALKNDATQAGALQPSFDWMVAEDCYVQGWCSALASFVNAGKVAVAIEYDDDISPTSFAADACPAAKNAGYQTILKHRNLDAWRQPCPS